jgi:hypothetical protein
MAPDRIPSAEECEQMDTNQKVQAVQQMLEWLKHTESKPTPTPEEKEERVQAESRLAHLRRLIELDEAYNRQRKQEGNTPTETPSEA